MRICPREEKHSKAQEEGPEMQRELEGSTWRNNSVTVTAIPIKVMLNSIINHKNGENNIFPHCRVNNFQEILFFFFFFT